MVLTLGITIVRFNDKPAKNHQIVGIHFYRRIKLINFYSNIANETISAEINELEVQTHYYRLKFQKKHLNIIDYTKIVVDQQIHTKMKRIFVYAK